MANSLKGEVAAMVDGFGELRLVFDMEALIEAEGAYGHPLAKVMGDAKAGFLGATRALLFGATRAHHRDLTARALGDLLLRHGDALGDALAKAFDAGQPEPDASAEGKEAIPPAGSTSGSSGAKRASNRKASGA